MVENATQARRVMEATRYPPYGFRGVGSALARASQFGAIGDYLDTANEQIFLMVQIESARGLAALDDILAIEGVDGIFIGPSDLAADLGHLGQPAHPLVLAAVTDALARIRSAGRCAGVLSSDPVYIEACTTAGANFIGVGIDVTLFAAAMRTLSASYRKRG